MSNLVNYSSEEEAEASTEQPAPKQNDVNYDDVNMDMSEDENEDKEAAMFASKEDYQAYKQQFASEKANKSPKHERDRWRPKSRPEESRRRRRSRSEDEER